MPNNKKHTALLEKLPKSHLASLADKGFVTVAYLGLSVQVETEDGGKRSEWLPRLCVAPGPTSTTYRVIEWLPQGHPSNGYGFSGWQVMSGHTTGGFYQEIGQAISWFDWFGAQKSS